MKGHLLTVGATVALPLLLAVCGGPTASPVGSERAGDDLTSNLTARGITVDEVADGDAGCPYLGLDDQAARIDVTLADGSAYPVFVVEWSDQQSYADANGPSGRGAHPVWIWQECLNAYMGAHRLPVVSVEAYPWRAYGPDWPDALRQAVLDSLHALGGL